MKKRKTKRRHVCVPQRDGTVRCEELSRAESAELWSRIKARTHPAKGKDLNGFRGTGVKRSPAELLDVLAKRAPSGLHANVSRIYLGLKKGRLSENRVRALCKARPEMLSVADARKVFDSLTKAAGISGSTDFAGRGVWEGAEEDSVVFESLHVGGGPDLQKFQSKMNAIARTAGQRTCQDSVMVIHQQGDKATVDFISHLGKRSQRRYAY